MLLLLLVSTVAQKSRMSMSCWWLVGEIVELKVCVVVDGWLVTVGCGAGNVHKLVRW